MLSILDYPDKKKEKVEKEERKRGKEINPKGEGDAGGGVCRGGIVQSKLFERSRARAITPPAITTPRTKGGVGRGDRGRVHGEEG